MTNKRQAIGNLNGDAHSHKAIALRIQFFSCVIRRQRSGLYLNVFAVCETRPYHIEASPRLSVRDPSRPKVNPLSGLELTSSAFVTGCLGALPIFIASVLLEKSGVGFFRKIDQDTKLYVVQLFGAERNLPVRSVP